MSANRPRSIKEFFTHKESRQQESCLRENDNPTPCESSDEGSERRSVDYSSQGKRFHLCCFWFIQLEYFSQVNELTQPIRSIFNSIILLAPVKRTKEAWTSFPGGRDRQKLRRDAGIL